LLSGIDDRHRGDRGPQRVVRREGTVVAVPVLSWRRHQIGKSVEELKRREIRDAILTAPAWTVHRL